MTCHRDGARHCSCAPAAADVAPGADAPQLVLTSPDPRAHAALRALASPLEVEVVAPGPSTSCVTGAVGALLLAAVGALPVAGLPAPAPSDPSLEVRSAPERLEGLEPVDGPAADLAAEAADPTAEAAEVRDARPLGPVPLDLRPDLRPEARASLPLRGDLLASLTRELGRQRPGTTTGLLFCATGDRTPDGTVLGVVASRLRRHVRRSDAVAHLGGGRFVAVMSELPLDSGEAAAARVVTAVRDALAEPVSTTAGLFPLRTVVGVLVHPGEDAEGWETAPTAEDMLVVVERAMERGDLPTA